MIVLDTNVVSELIRPKPSESVLEWFSRHEYDFLFVTTTTLAEIRYGLRVMPAGKRQSTLTAIFESFIAEVIQGSILDFTDAAAQVYADIAGRRKAMGQPMSMADAQIAAVALQCGCALATRNIKDFHGVGLELLNPFEDET